MYIADEQAEAWKRALELARVDLDTLLVKIAKAAIITYMEFEKAMVQVAKIVQTDLAAVEVEKAALLELPTEKDRKAAREKRRTVEREAASRFRQYKARERNWNVQKRTGPRQREWRGPWRGEKN